MINCLSDLDRILRGEATRLSALRGETIDINGGRLAIVIVGLAMIYGASMGCFAAFHPERANLMQMLASAVKVPALFYLTLAITFPSLYVFNALVGSRLDLVALARLMIASLGVNLAVLASLGPIVAFFSLSTTSYPFMVLLNVVVMAISGALGLTFLLQTLHRMTVARIDPRPDPAAPAPQPPAGGEPPSLAGGESPAADTPTPVQAVEEPGALDWLGGLVLGRNVKTVFNCWVVVFALVGAQMGWVLRPFIGSPDSPFEWFRTRQSNFFEAVWRALVSLIS